MSEFMSATTSILVPGWLPYRIASFVVGKPLWWALEQIGIVDNDSEGHQNSNSLQVDWFGEYVFVELLEHAADAVLTLQKARATGLADALYTTEDFRKTFGSIFSVSKQSALSETDAKVLIKFLERERKAIVTDNEVSILDLQQNNGY